MNLIILPGFHVESGQIVNNLTKTNAGNENLKIVGGLKNSVPAPVPKSKSTKNTDLNYMNLGLAYMHILV